MTSHARAGETAAGLTSDHLAMADLITQKIYTVSRSIIKLITTHSKGKVANASYVGSHKFKPHNSPLKCNMSPCNMQNVKRQFNQSNEEKLGQSMTKVMK